MSKRPSSPTGLPARQKIACFGQRSGFGLIVLIALLLLAAVNTRAVDSPSPAGDPETNRIDLSPSDTPREQVTVILLHGMGRSRAALWMLDTRLRQAGFSMLSYAYSARAEDIESITSDFLKFIRGNVNTPVYHVVTHSHASIVARLAFRQGYPPGLGRLVMIAPPNRPPELARTLRENPIYRWVTGESAGILASEEFFAALPIPSVPFGIIAGNRGQRPTLGKPNDGVVTVDGTRLEGMSDWTVLPYAHNFLVTSREVAYHVIWFLEHGRFADQTELSRAMSQREPPPATSSDRKPEKGTTPKNIAQ